MFGFGCLIANLRVVWCEILGRKILTSVTRAS